VIAVIEDSNIANMARVMEVKTATGFSQAARRFLAQILATVCVH
jgi:hypothetical protein